jgi:hypothetical protein
MSEHNDLQRDLHMDMRLAEDYIPIQMYGETFDLRTALINGTIFPELYRPYPPRTAV